MLTQIIMAFPKPTKMEFSYPKTWTAEETGVWTSAHAGVSWASFGGVGAATLAHIGEGLAPNAAYAAASGSTGLAVNKHNKVIFEDLPFREVSLAWDLKPTNEEQASGFQEAINALKIVSAPAYAFSHALWDVSDCTFSLELKSSAGVLFKSQQLVIRNLTVDYTGAGFWSQHKDGYPTQINLSIDLMETELLDRSKFGGGAYV